jgi:hypothetical protein
MYYCALSYCYDDDDEHWITFQWKAHAKCNQCAHGIIVGPSKLLTETIQGAAAAVGPWVADQNALSQPLQQWAAVYICWFFWICSDFNTNIIKHIYIYQTSIHLRELQNPICFFCVIIYRTSHTLYKYTMYDPPTIQYHLVFQISQE